MRNTLDTIQAFIRATFFGYTSTLVLVGAGAVNPAPTTIEIVVLVIVALNFHCFGYVHNDVVDLAVDRTAPARSEDPLVTGQISPGAALVFAWAQIPISFGIAFFGGVGWRAIAILALGYLAAIAYNHFGKRCPIPMITDAVQGVAWISICLFGALSMGQISGLALVIAAFGFGFIFLINGVHGGLRDLRNDIRHGKMTTAIYLGARSVDAGRVRSTLRLQLFAVVPLAIMTVPIGVALLGNSMGYDQRLQIYVLAAWLAVTAVAVWLFWQVVAADRPDVVRRKAIYGNAFFLLLGPQIAFLPMLSGPLQAAVLICFAVPLIVFQDRVAEVRTILEGWRSSYR